MKNVALFHSIHRGSSYYNCKGFNIIILLTLVGADYKFVYVDIGCQSCLIGQFDRAVLRNASFQKSMITKSLNLPDPRQLPELSKANDSFVIDSQRQTSFPYEFLADDVFPLSTICMKPYIHKNLLKSYILLNCSLSRTRRTKENAFGVFSNRFRILCFKIYLKPEIGRKIAMASCLLHNILRTHYAADCFVTMLQIYQLVVVMKFLRTVLSSTGN